VDQFSAMVEYDDASKRINVYGVLSFLRNRNQAEYTLAGAAKGRLPLAYRGVQTRGIPLKLMQWLWT
jgi:hypothetical protein